MNPAEQKDPARSLAAERFGRFAEAYASSATFAQADELPLLVRLAAPQPDWSVLDVATGAGHTALAFAPHVARVVATDVAPAMLEQGRRIAAERGIRNVSFEQAEAEALPYGKASFELVTCRIAPHHFASPARFLSEARRVLRRGGRLLVQDHVLPEDEAGARAIDGFERLRDPSHVRAFSQTEWTAMLLDAGLRPAHVERVAKRHRFSEWTSRQGCSEETVARLVEMMQRMQGAVREWMRPEHWGTAEASFCDHHIIVLSIAP